MSMSITASKSSTPSCKEAKDRCPSMGTSATENSTVAGDDELSVSEFSEIHEDELVEFDDLEKELVNFSLSQRNRSSHSRQPRRRSKGNLSSNSSCASIASSSGHSSTGSVGSIGTRESVGTRGSTGTVGSGSRRKTRPSRRKSALPVRDLEDKVKSRIRRAFSHNAYQQDPNQTVGECSSQQACSAKATQQTPEECLRVILNGVSPSTFKSETWEGYFTAVTYERLTAYSLEVSKAIRNDQLSVLRELHAKGVNLDSCNPHGESMMHLACRLGKLDIVKFLIEEADVSVRVQDDTGRTPLHDACWTNKPNFDLIKLILETSPELLFIEDRRGFAAFRYIPQNAWPEWCEFLQSRQAFLRLKVNDSGYMKARDSLDDAQKRLQALLKKAAEYE